jgi:hypothetical protein
VGIIIQEKEGERRRRRRRGMRSQARGEGARSFETCPVREGPGKQDGLGEAREVVMLGSVMHPSQPLREGEERKGGSTHAAPTVLDAHTRSIYHRAGFSQGDIDCLPTTGE